MAQSGTLYRDEQKIPARVYQNTPGHTSLGPCHTDVSELSRNTNLLLFGSTTSSDRLNLGRLLMVQINETSPCLSWNSTPSARGRARRSSETSAQRCKVLDSCSADSTGPSTRNGSRKARGDASWERQRAK